VTDNEVKVTDKVGDVTNKVTDNEVKVTDKSTNKSYRNILSPTKAKAESPITRRQLAQSPDRYRNHHNLDDASNLL